MIPPMISLIGFLATLPGAVAVTINMCAEETCGDCPSSLLVTEPTDGKPCIIYARSDIITGNDFPPSADGVQDAWINATPDPNTGLIVRSPADTGAQYCGVAVGTVNSPNTCGKLALQDTLTFVICHGPEECVDQGIPGGPYVPPSRFMVREDKNLASGQSLVTAVRRAAGSIVKPLAATLDGKDFMDGFFALFNATEQLEESRRIEKGFEVGPSATLVERASTVAPGGDPPPPMDTSNHPVNGPGDKECTLFTADDRAGYIRADFKTVSTGFNVQATSEGASIMDQYTSSTSWTTTISAGLNIDIFSASVDFSVSEMQSETSGFSINVPPNQSGYIGWTPYYICAHGTATCPAGDQTGEACTPYNFNGGQPAGEYTFVQNFT